MTIDAWPLGAALAGVLGAPPDAWPTLLAALPLLAWMGKRGQPPGRPGEPPGKPGETPGSARNLAELEDEVERLRMIIRRTAALNATLNYERVMDMVLDLSASAIASSGPEDTRLVSALLLFQNNRLAVAYARGLTSADLRVSLPGETGVIEQALSAARLQVCQDPSRDPELQRFAAMQQARSGVVIPLVVGLECFGLMLFAHPDSDYFNGERRELLEAISTQAVTALQNARLYRDLEQEKENLTEVQEEARKKLARDLHDGPTQSISAIAMRVNFARRLMERDPKSAADELFKIEELARRTTKEIRQMLFTLRPLVLESEGLVPALEHLAAKVRETHGQNVIIEAEPGVADDLEIGKQGVVFYIAEEAVTNARKHAQAEHVWIRVKRQGDLVGLEIEDDGVGFDVAEISANYEQRGSLGMINLHERAELVNGVLKVDSARGRGTRISATVPLTVEAAERLHRPGFSG